MIVIVVTCRQALGSVPGLKERLSAVLGQEIEATDEGAGAVETLVRRIEAEDNGIVGFYHYILVCFIFLFFHSFLLIDMSIPYVH